MTDVVTAFLVRRLNSDFQVLVLRRSDRVGSYQGKWAGISGYLERESPLEQALIEIEEEAGIDRAGAALLSRAEPIEILDESIGKHWRVHPFLFEVADPDSICTDWEHTEWRWVAPETLRELDTVPGLADALDALLAFTARDTVTGKRQRRG